ncbi:hypothetical protein EJ110_NYTH00423 [Nymphaea thermarum]|nr:hypothetical protein EJ110_NYTH00423 [Nymphaea thermarum]
MARSCAKKMLQLSQRTYAVLASTGGKPTKLPEGLSPCKLVEPHEQTKQVYWMRDPITGYWKPEDHFNETDPAELRRAKLIPKKD